MNQEELDIWMAGTIKYYNKHSITKITNMENLENKVQLLLKANERLTNLVNNLTSDLEKFQETVAANSVLTNDKFNLMNRRVHQLETNIVFQDGKAYDAEVAFTALEILPLK